MNTKTFEKSKRRLSIQTVAAFFLSMVLCGLFLYGMVRNKANLDRLMMEQIIIDRSVQLTEVIHRLLYKTEALSALVIQSNGSVHNFDRVASTLLDDPAILNVLIAPAGTVSNVYPLKGNESVLGFDYFQAGPGNREAMLARETGELVFGGPFPVGQGGQALVGRLPVYRESHVGGKTFWGLVSVTLKYPQVLDGLGLASLEKQGYAFELWRTNVDTGQRQTIASSRHAYNKKARFIEKDINILNAVWHFRLSPVRMWYQYMETWVLAIFGVFFSGLLAFVVQNNYELKFMQGRLEEMARNDSLTGIANRRHFLEMAPIHLQQADRNRQSCFVIMFDVDQFKKINDTHGHGVGDIVLKIMSARVKKIIRPYDLFARYGGEEFILLVTDVDRQAAEQLAERMRLALCETPFIFGDLEIQGSASFGLARVSPGASLEAIIKRADDALYTAKAEGRNKTVCFTAPDEG